MISELMQIRRQVMSVISLTVLLWQVIWRH